MPKNRRVAVVQAAPVSFNLPESLAKVRDLTENAARQGAQLVVFPEAFLSAYPRGITFNTVVGHRDPEGREWYRRYWDSSVDIPGPAVKTLCDIAKENRVHLVIGVIERDGGTLYCTALFLGPDGAYLGKHRKLGPTGAERLVWGRGDGSTMPVFSTEVGKIGASICWENYMPLFRAAMYQKGVEVLCVPTADGRETWLPTMRHIALEGRCFVLSSNQFARRSDYPEDYLAFQNQASDSIVTVGGSCIIDPLGNVLAGPNFDGEAVLIADIDLDDITRAKFDLDAVGHYSRPDVFRLLVNESSQKLGTPGWPQSPTTESEE
ncbi:MULTISPECIES: carbon-nitrogen hydrolase family protein [Burkholderiaceae]|uniref:Nitrilase n=1 Tax=Caballeronia zhejiangensis TaxID=871203 RepID=A0A656QB90_9BURK|nr:MULTISPECIES: carbon-nitrogen hydrolase family protein [Burkholderiaceae]KAK43534.1 nitrilase [Caballeronia jiangsuensis]KDR26112.1 nitrilase [Caballeronia zhejiangensis]SAL77704.1 nitrilase/cyanide hydratase and apolipoprotein N-acyltransferase [Caballeronia peredens]